MRCCKLNVILKIATLSSFSKICNTEYFKNYLQNRINTLHRVENEKKTKIIIVKSRSAIPWLHGLNLIGEYIYIYI